MPGHAACHCHCAEKDNLIRLLTAQVDQLQTRKRMLQGANLQLREQLEDSVQKLEARLEFKEDEVQSLRGTCREMSSHVMVCEERVVALQEELAKREELLRANSSFTDPFRWSIDTLPTLDGDSPAYPPALHSACVQTSPRQGSACPQEGLSPRERLSPREASYTSEDFCPMSARGTAPASMAEVQELRYTVQVLKEQLEEWQSAPNSPAHASSPARRLQPCASLADMLDTSRLRPPPSLDLSGSGHLSPLLSPASRQTLTPLRDQLSPYSEAESQPDPATLEGQVLYTLLTSELHFAETIARQALHLEQDTARQEAVMERNWTIAQLRLLLRGVAQLCCLDAAERQQLLEAEENFRELMSGDRVQMPLDTRPCGNPTYIELWMSAPGGSRQSLAIYDDEGQLPHATLPEMEYEEAQMWTPPLLTDSPASSVGEDFSSLAQLEDPQDPWALPLPESYLDGTLTPGSLSDSGLCPAEVLATRHRRAARQVARQESAGWARLRWLRDVEYTRCIYKALLQTQLSHGRLAETIETEERELRRGLRQMFETELWGCLQSLAQRRYDTKQCEIWENERWVPFLGWGRALLGRPPLSDASGRCPLDPAVLDALVAREGRRWASAAWELDPSFSDDAQGWRYALAFGAPFQFRSGGFGTLVRRRKWVRAAELCPVAADVSPACGETFLHPRR
eukprot:EG_transcript_1860